MTLSDLKRNAAKGNMKLELVERYGKRGEDIPERIRGVRTVKRVNTVALILVNDDGQESELRYNGKLESAKLFEYDGKTLTVYEAGTRDLTEEEQRVLDEWNIIQAEYIRENPYSDAYWKMKEYFKNCPCSWMEGLETVCGKYYMRHNGKVRDNQVRGNVILRYNVYMTD